MGETLGSPQNVTAQDYTVSFDEVPRATNYDILANNAVIGNVQGANINMAEKILNTRIQLRYDTYDNWTTNNPVLKQGEIAVVKIDTADPANQKLPPIMFKVGNSADGANFNDLGWTSALAADVYAWAKKSGIEIETSGSGSFVKDVEWNATANKLKITKGNVDLSGKQNKTISLDGITATTVEGALTDINGVAKAKYSKPGDGIPKSDLAAAVQTSLGKADTAIQSLVGYATENYVDLQVAGNNLTVTDDNAGNVTFSSGSPINLISDRYELIEEITLDNAVVGIDRRSDLNGVTYNLKKLLITIDLTSKSFSNCYVLTNLNGERPVYATPTNTHKNLTLQLFIEGVILQGLGTATALNQVTNNYLNRIPVKQVNDNIHRFSLICNSGQFSAGDTIKIYGVRA